MKRKNRKCWQGSIRQVKNANRKCFTRSNWINRINKNKSRLRSRLRMKRYASLLNKIKRLCDVNKKIRNYNALKMKKQYVKTKRLSVNMKCSNARQQLKKKLHSSKNISVPNFKSSKNNLKTIYVVKTL